MDIVAYERVWIIEVEVAHGEIKMLTQDQYQKEYASEFIVHRMVFILQTMLVSARESSEVRTYSDPPGLANDPPAHTTAAAELEAP